LSQESPAYSVIKYFEEDTHPIFVVYGTPPYFTEVIDGFRDHFQRRPEDLYFFLDMEMNKRNTPGETFFEIVRQIIDLLLDTILDPEEQIRLLQPFRMLTNLKEKTRTYEPDEQLAEFVRFTYYSCYPTLGEVFCNRKQLIIIEFKRFETVVEWGKKIHNYILDSLLKNTEGGNLRFILFVQSDTKPSLFYGSDEESSRKKVTFHKLEYDAEQTEFVPHQYLTD
jgi:hypothetical protein